MDPAWKVDELRLAHSRIHIMQHHAALKMMDCLFTVEALVEDMVNGNPFREYQVCQIHIW